MAVLSTGPGAQENPADIVKWTRALVGPGGDGAEAPLPCSLCVPNLSSNPLTKA